MKLTKYFLLIIILLLGTLQCSNIQKKELEVEKAKLIIDPEENISKRIETMIKEAEWPTEEQKIKLLELKTDTQKKVVDLNLKIKKAKILLVQNLIISETTYVKIELLKKEIKKLYRKKINVMMDATEVARKILGKGKELTQLDSMYHHYLLNEYYDP